MPLTFNPLVPEKQTVNPLVEEQQPRTVFSDYHKGLRSRLSAEVISNTLNVGRIESYQQTSQLEPEEADDMAISAAQERAGEVTSNAFAAAVEGQDIEAARAIVSTSEELKPEDISEAYGWIGDLPSVYWTQDRLEDAFVSSVYDNSRWTQILSDIIIPTDSKDVEDTFGGNWFTSEEHFKTAAENYKQLSQSEQSIVFPKIAEAVLEGADGNTSTAARILQMFSGPIEDISLDWDKIDAALAVFDFAAASKALAKIAYRGARTMNAARASRSVEEQMAVMNEAIKSDRAARGLGTTRENTAIGAMDQEGVLNTGFPAGTGESLDRWYRMTEDYYTEVIRTRGLIGTPDVTEEYRKLITEEISPNRYYILGPDPGLGPTAEAKAVFPVFFSRMQNSRVTQDFLRPLLGELNKHASKSGLGKEKLNDIMLRLDDANKELSSSGFRRMLETEYKLKGTQLDNAVNYYTKYRDLAFIEYTLLNQGVRANKLKQGWESLMRIGDRGIVGHKFDNISDARRSASERDVKYFWDEETGARRKFDDLKDTENVSIFRAEKGHRISESERYDYVAVAPDKISDLPTFLVEYKPGYVPKFNKDVNYVVTRKIMGELNGVKNQEIGSETVEAFSNVQKARAFAGDNPELLVTRARELRDPDEIIDVYNLWGGGMYTGKRKSGGLLVDGKIAKRKYDASESLQKAMDFVQRQQLLGPTKDYLQDLWTKTALEAGVIDSKAASKIFKDRFNSPIGDPVMKQRMKVFHNYVARMTDNTSTLEQQTEQLLIKMAENAKSPIVGEAFTRAHSWNLAQKTKSAAYHSFLGLLSPSQWVVQSSTGMYVFAARPKAFTQALPYIHNSRLADLYGKPLAGDMKKAYDMWRESGLAQSVRNHPDLAHMSRYGSTASKLERLSTWFVEEGEETARRMAFFTAYKSLPGGTLQEVATETRRLMMDMTQSNKANWQEGWAGVFTQFQQILAKSYAQSMPKILGGKSTVTGWEKGRIAAIQAALFGAAGIPFGTLIYSLFDGHVANGTLSSSQAEGLKRGFTGWMLDQLDIHSDVQTRLNLAASLPMFFEQMFEDNSIDITALLGPAGQLVQRTSNAMYDGVQWMREGRWDMVAASLANIPSGIRNPMAAWFAYSYQKQFSKKGQRYPAPELNSVEAFLAALGFPSTETQDYFDLKRVKSAADEADKYINNQIIKLVTLDPKFTEFDASTIGMLMALDPERRYKAYEAIGEAAASNETFNEQIYDIWVKNPALGTGLNPLIQREREKFYNADIH